MSRFKYTARGPNGLVQGSQDALSADMLAQELHNKGWVPLTIREDKAPAGSQPLAMPGFLAPKVTQVEVMLLSKQIHTLFKAGVPILRALTGLQETATNPSLKKVIGALRTDLESGLELSAAMSRHPKVFDNFFVSMVRVGEATGQLEEVFMRLTEHLEFEMFMNQQVKSALRYPTFVIIAMVVAIGVINVMVIPQFSSVFKSLGGNLPTPTLILVSASNFTLNYWKEMLTVFVTALLFWARWRRSPLGRPVWDRTVLRMPLAGPIVHKAAIARFTRGFSLALRSGVPLEQALSSVALTTDNAYLTQCIHVMRERVMRGEALSSAAAGTGVFTPLVLQMIAVGEETGMLDELLDDVGEIYTNDVQYALKTLSQQIEPILIFFMGGLVLLLALGVFLPMWNLGGAAMGR